MQTLLFRRINDEVYTLKKNTSSSLETDYIYIYDSGLLYPSRSMGCWFGGKLHYIKLQASGELTLVSYVDGVETIELNAGIKNWQSAYVYKINDSMLLFICKSDLDFLYYTWDGTTSNLFSCSASGQRIWYLYLYSGIFYAVLDTDVLRFALGQIPEKLGLNTNMQGGSLFEFGGELYLVNPMIMSMFVSKFNFGTAVSLSPLESLSGMTVYPFQSDAVLYKSKIYIVFSHQYGKVFYEYNGSGLKSLLLPRDLMLTGSDNVMFADSDKIYLLSSNQFNEDVFYCIYPESCLLGGLNSFWRYV